MKTVGEVAMIDKKMLYELLKPYANAGKSSSNI